MAYPAPIRLKTQYTFNTKALADSMRLDGRTRILESDDIKKALEHLDKHSYRNRAGYSMIQTIGNLCEANGVPVYARDALLDEVERYQDACITEGRKVYPSKSVLITWLAKYHSDDRTTRAPGETKADAYRRIKAGMKRKFSGNSSYQKAKLINDYESALAIVEMKNKRWKKLAAEVGPLEDDRVVLRRPKTVPQLRIEFGA